MHSFLQLLVEKSDLCYEVFIAQSSSLTWGFHKNLHFINYCFITFYSDIKSYLFWFSELFARVSGVTSFSFFEDALCTDQPVSRF